MAKNPFWHKKLEDLTKEEWEALCDGCGLCCLNKLEYEDTGELAFTSVACNLFNEKTCRCQDYENRKVKIPDCVTFTLKNVYEIDWLPPTCAYRLRAQGKPLFEWHYLISGSRETVHARGISARGKVTAHERDLETLDDYEDHPLTLPTGDEK